MWRGLDSIYAAISHVDIDQQRGKHRSVIVLLILFICIMSLVISSSTLLSQTASSVGEKTASSLRNKNAEPIQSERDIVPVTPMPTNYEKTHVAVGTASQNIHDVVRPRSSTPLIVTPQHVPKRRLRQQQWFYCHSLAGKGRSHCRFIESYRHSDCHLSVP